jgi:hypothetical protein
MVNERNAELPRPFLKISRKGRNRCREQNLKVRKNGITVLQL